MMQVSYKLIALSLLLASTSALATRVYTWEDSTGQVYYSQTKPTDFEYKEVDPPPPPPSLAPDLNKPFEEQIRKSIKDQKEQ